MTIRSILPMLVFATSLASIAAKAEDHPALRLNTLQYEHRIDTLIRDFRVSGKIPSTNDILRIRTLENQMLALATVNPALVPQLPPLLLTLIDLRDLRYIPGQVMIERLNKAGLDPLADRAAGRTFQLASGSSH